MIAALRPAPQQLVPTSHDKFLSMLPQIRDQARVAFRGLPREQREELIQEVIANAYCAYARLVAKGKLSAVFATPLARFAIRQTRSGRRVGAKLNVRDITSPYAARIKGITVERLDRFDREEGEWIETLVEDRRAGPAETAAARIDTAAWFRKLPSAKRRIAKLLATGETTQITASRFGLSEVRISQLRREFHESWLTMHGEAA